MNSRHNYSKSCDDVTKNYGEQIAKQQYQRACITEFNDYTESLQELTEHDLKSLEDIVSEVQKQSDILTNELIEFENSKNQYTTEHNNAIKNIEDKISRLTIAYKDITLDNKKHRDITINDLKAAEKKIDQARIARQSQINDLIESLDILSSEVQQIDQRIDYRLSSTNNILHNQDIRPETNTISSKLDLPLTLESPHEYLTLKYPDTEIVETHGKDYYFQADDNAINNTDLPSCTRVSLYSDETFLICPNLSSRYCSPERTIQILPFVIDNNTPEKKEVITKDIVDIFDTQSESSSSYKIIKQEKYDRNNKQSYRISLRMNVSRGSVNLLKKYNYKPNNHNASEESNIYSMRNDILKSFDICAAEKKSVLDTLFNRNIETIDLYSDEKVTELDEVLSSSVYLDLDSDIASKNEKVKDSSTKQEKKKGIISMVTSSFTSLINLRHI